MPDLMNMKWVLDFSIKTVVVLLGVGVFLACTPKEKPVTDIQVNKSVIVTSKKAIPPQGKDQILQGVARLFEQADGVHREAWRVLVGEKVPEGKSAFGKVQRAILSAQNIKLSNKSLFKCDRYQMKRDVLSAVGYPQRAEIFEKCSEKADAKKIAEWSLEKPHKVVVTFFSENLEEVLGLGATILNKKTICQLEGNDLNQLILFSCKDWAQDRTKDEMIRLDIYEYRKANNDLLKLKGKVFKHLSESRKIEVEIPLEGKIKITETELYAPEESSQPAVSPSPSKKSEAKSEVSDSMQPERGQNPGEAGARGATDPDLKRMQQRVQQPLPPPDYHEVGGANGEEAEPPGNGGPGQAVDENTGEIIQGPSSEEEQPEATEGVQGGR